MKIQKVPFKGVTGVCIEGQLYESATASLNVRQVHVEAQPASSRCLHARVQGAYLS